MNAVTKNVVHIVPEKETGFRLRVGEGAKVIKRGQYWVTDFSVTGEAPKDFIKVYEFGQCRKANRKGWVGYIAKVGHKWYPNESITEYLLNRLGEAMGFNMARSRLAWINGQLRFLSLYFLKGDEVLFHGAQIFWGYLSNDEEFVREIEDKKLSRELFTLQFVKEAVTFGFPNEAERILKDFIKMVVFDAFVGNSDRHFFNWGVIRDATGNKPSHFSPIYDTARGLFWNEPESKIIKRYCQKGEEPYLRYIQESRPKVGWEGERNINHIRLVELISQNQFVLNRSEILNIISEANLNRCINVLKSEFSSLMSKERQTVVGNLLRYRYETLKKFYRLEGE